MTSRGCVLSHSGQISIHFTARRFSCFSNPALIQPFRLLHDVMRGRKEESGSVSMSRRARGGVGFLCRFLFVIFVDLFEGGL